MPVDDFLYGRTLSGVRRFELELRSAFAIGAVEVGHFAFAGRDVSCKAPHAHDIVGPAPVSAVWVQQHANVDSLDAIPLSAARAASAVLAVTAEELTLYRRATGALLWAAGQTLLHLAFGAAVLARPFKHTLVSDLVRAIRPVAEALRSRDCELRLGTVGAP